VDEDEAFQLLDKQQQQVQILAAAQSEAMEFINDHASELGIMTLRKAFEIGYRRGAYAETWRRNATNKS
jgi:hypothetical protein